MHGASKKVEAPDSRTTTDFETGTPLGARSEKNFRFYDNRQNYLLFVNTCSEKWVVAERVSRELEAIDPAQPAIRFFDRSTSTCLA